MEHLFFLTPQEGSASDRRAAPLNVAGRFDRPAYRWPAYRTQASCSQRMVGVHPSLEGNFLGLGHLRKPATFEAGEIKTARIGEMFRT